MRKTPQIPRDVFFGDPATAEPVAPVAEPVVAPAITPLPQPLTPVAPPVAVAPAPVVEEDKIQVTVYLSPQIAKRLEALRFHLLNEHNVRVSKSAIAEYAISNVEDDLAPLAQHFAIGER
ncbi:MAG: hypothetical protein ACYC63_13840 [Armatimonadota bacterium]